MLIGVLLGASAWLASGSCVSLPHDPAHVEYLFLSASWTRLAICIALACALIDSRARAWDAFTKHGCTLCLSSEHGRVPPAALASLKPEPER